MNMPPTDPTPNAALSPDGRTPWPRWLKIALVVGVVGVAAAIIAVVASSGSDSGKTTGTANTADQTTAAANSTGSTSTASGTATTAAASVTTSASAAGTGTASQSTTSTASSAPTTAPVSGGSEPTTTAPTPPAATKVDLGDAGNFGVLGNSAVGSKGPTTVNGQVGASNGEVTGFTAGGNPSGVIVVDSVTAEQGEVAAQRVADQLDALPRSALDSPELVNQTITPGTYGAATLGVTGTVTLDAGGDPNARFVFESGSTLEVAAASEIVLAGGAQACNVFWRVGGSATFRSGASFAGVVIANDSITAANGAAFAGRLMALNGAVTLDTNTIDVGTCS
jgi:hypothetical protein